VIASSVRRRPDLAAFCAEAVIVARPSIDLWQRKEHLVDRRVGAVRPRP